MTRAWNRLTANFVRGASKRGRHADGGGLYLQIATGGTKATRIHITLRTGPPNRIKCFATRRMQRSRSVRGSTTLRSIRTEN